MSFEVNTGTAASALDGTEKMPVSQGALPRVVTTARFPYLNSAGNIFTDRPVHIDNGSGGYLAMGDIADPFSISFSDGSGEVLFTAPATLRVLADGGSIANAGGSTTYFSWTSVAGVSGCTVRCAPSTSTTGLRLYDADGSHTLNIAVGSNLTATRTLTLTTGNANRTLDISAGSVTISTAGAALIDDADAPAQRTTLGLGTAAVKNTGVSGDAVPVLNGAATTWSAGATFGTASGATATPTAIALDATYRNSAADNSTLKLFLYKPASGDETYGLGVNNGAAIEYHAGGPTTSAGRHHEFYTGNVLRTQITETGIETTGYVKPASFTVAGVPSASTAGAGAMIFVTNESGGAVPAFSDGTNWRRVTDRAVIS